MKVKVEWARTANTETERHFEELLDRFMAAQGFDRYGSGFNLVDKVRDIAYEREN